jgi:transcriptional regulator with XRE-family HTH domain
VLYSLLWIAGQSLLRRGEMQFDERYQVSKDGPLTRPVRDRLQRFREVGFTLREIGDRLGFSGAFVSQLLNEKNPARVRSVHIPAMIQAIEHAEIENGLRTGKNKGKSVDAPDRLTLEELIRAIAAKGFEVTIKPKGI